MRKRIKTKNVRLFYPNGSDRTMYSIGLHTVAEVSTTFLDRLYGVPTFGGGEIVQYLRGLLQLFLDFFVAD